MLHEHYTGFRQNYYQTNTYQYVFISEKLKNHIKNVSCSYYLIIETKYQECHFRKILNIIVFLKQVHILCSNQIYFF